MQNFPSAGASRRRNVPVELIVIGAAIALGALFANGRAAETRKDAATPVAEGERSVETGGPAGEDAEEASAVPAKAERRATGTAARPASVAMPSGIPADMPTFEDATLVSASADDGAGEYVLTWSVPASASAEAAKAYAALLEAKGWSVTSTTENPGSSVIVFERAATKGGRGWVAFIGDAPDVSATLTLSLAH